MGGSRRRHVYPRALAIWSALPTAVRARIAAPAPDGYRRIRRSLATILRVGIAPLRRIAEAAVFVTLRLWLKAYEVPADQRTREYRELFRIISAQPRRDKAQGAG